MRRVTCECGQSFAPFLINGVPRSACPYCKRPLTLNSDGTLAGTTPAAPPPSQRVSELQPVVAPPTRPPASYPCEASGALETRFPAVYNQSPRNFAPSNLWRDSNRIVVLGNWPTFPPVCVLTGRTDNLTLMPQTVKFLPNQWVWVLFFGILGAAIGQAFTGTTLNLSVPVSSEYLAQKRRHFLMGICVFLVSGFLLVLGSLIFIVNWREDSDFLMIPMLLTMACGLGGLIYMAIAGSHGRLTCNRMEGDCMWLVGASPDLLKHLPDWSTTGPRGATGVIYRAS